MAADEAGNFEQPSSAMRNIQQRQTLFADSLDPRRPSTSTAAATAPLNDDLAFSQVYAPGRDEIVVDFAAKEEMKQAPLAIPVGAFPP
mmetsp:Transcript_46045/g.60994  ORF Transcript_46045/g.60994 Transcript_46045/m.60994 type:complete len:88 (-) Transcript_46045:1367-1630(-)